MAGAGYKLFNTGDVLTAAQVNTYLMEQTVMVFDDATARTTALTGVVSEGMISYLKDTNAVEVYDGSNWVASDDPNAIQNSIVDAKGDLISATADNTPARLAVGNNGETLVADSSASTGLRWQNPKSVNYILNSNLNIWQRGTSFALASGTITYTADRWAALRGATGATITRQTTSDTTNLPSIKYAIRIQRDSGNSSTNNIAIGQSFENDSSTPLIGKTVVYSFWARKGADASTATMSSSLVSGTGTNQNELGGFTGAATVASTAPTLTTDWVRYSATGTVSSSATQIAIRFTKTSAGTAGANDWIEITGVQVEIGSVATAFQTATGTLAGELAACQRYYWRQNPGSNAFGNLSLNGATTSTTNAEIYIQAPNSMRVTPTVVDFSTLRISPYASALGALAVTAATLSARSNDLLILVNCTVSGATDDTLVQLQANNSTSAYIGFSAEL